MGFDEPFFNETLSAEVKHPFSQAEHGVDVGVMKVEEAVVQSCVEFDVYAVRDAQRKRCFGA